MVSRDGLLSMTVLVHLRQSSQQRTAWHQVQLVLRKMTPAVALRPSSHAVVSSKAPSLDESLFPTVAQAKHK